MSGPASYASSDAVTWEGACDGRLPGRLRTWLRGAADQITSQPLSPQVLDDLELAVLELATAMMRGSRRLTADAEFRAGRIRVRLCWHDEVDEGEGPPRFAGEHWFLVSRCVQRSQIGIREDGQPCIRLISRASPSTADETQA